VLLVLAVLGTYFPVALLAPVPAAVASIPDAAPQVTEAAALSTPAVGTSAIGLAGVGSDPGVTLGSSGTTDPVPIASITKTITALVVLQEKPIAEGEQGPDLTMTETDAQYLRDTIAVGGSWASVYPGQVLSERQVIEIMLLESANNYSLTLTTWAFGSVEAYLAAANAWLAEHALTGTAVVDTSGLDPGSRSTTHDLLTIGGLVLDDPVLSAIVGTASEQLPQLGEVENTNTLIGSDGIDGIKTGTTDEAGRCLLFSADYAVGEETVQLVGVVLGAASDDELHASVLALLQSAQAGFRTVDVVRAGDVVGTYSTDWGSTADIVAEQTVSTTVWSAATISETAEVDDVTSGASGTDVGTARYTVEGVSLGSSEFSVPLTLATTLEAPDAGWKLANPGRLFG
jgi:D-alanyl-D-alanine carboxypeptidase (penicillin-binding protein 5/6)